LLQLTKATEQSKKEDFISAFMLLNKINEEHFETIKNFITEDVNPNKGQKRPTLKNAFDELAFNFCQVCLQF